MLRGGFTGSQRGMTGAQLTAVAAKLAELRPDEAHHGDCVGADSYFHALAVEIGVPRIVIHPPVTPSKRAYCGDVAYARAGDKARVIAIDILPAKPYLARNHDIVDACDFLIACPAQDYEVLRSGTWATIRYAKTRNLLTYVFAPDGSQISW